MLVTGGNRGLGFELCKKLVMSGKRVLLTSRDSHAGEPLNDLVEWKGVIIEK